MIQTLENQSIPENVKANSELRDAYIKYQELASKGKLHIKPQKQITCDLQSQFYFYKHKDCLFFQHPDKQQEYYQNLIHKLNADLKPQRTISYHKQIELQIQNLNQQQYTPDSLKQSIKYLFKRKISSLKIRKLKTIQFTQDIGIQNPLVDVIFKQRIALIDNQLFGLYQRLERLKYNDFIKSYINTQQSLYSNLYIDDIEIYLRYKLLNLKTKLPLKKIEFAMKWIHFQNRIEIQEQANQILNSIRIKNVKINQKYFGDIILNIEGKLNLKYQMTKEVQLQLQDYLKPLKFCPSEEGSHIVHRFDKIPLIIFTEYEMQNRLHWMASQFLKNANNFGEQKLIFHLSNLQHMLDGYQRYLFAWEKKEKNEYDGYSGLQKLTIELSAFDDSEELISSLKNPLPIYSQVQLTYTKSDWKQLLNISSSNDEYQEYMNNQLKFVTIDIYVEKIIQLLPIHLSKLMSNYIDQHIKMMKEDNFTIFNIIENSDYIEYTRESIRLSQINELYEQIKSQEIFYRHKTKFKSELVKAFEEVMQEIIPKESHLQIYYSTMVCKMREYYRKIFFTLNAIQSIEKKLAQNLLIIRECKVNQSVDSHFLIKANQTLNEDQEQFQNQRRKAMISYSDAIENNNEKFFKNLKSEIKLQKIDENIIYSNEELPDVFVRSKQNNPIYESSIDQLKIVMKRLTQQISFYINKYEKINTVKKNNQLVDRFSIVLDCLECEANFQFKKLQLIQSYMEVYQNTVDPYQSNQITEQIFELMYQIPLMDKESVYFQDSYNLHIETYIQEKDLLQLLTQKQKQNECKQIKYIHNLYGQLRSTLQEDTVIESSLKSPQVNKSQNSRQVLDEQYDYYTVSNKMSQIFQELNQANKSSSQNLNSVSRDIKIIDPNAVLLPFQQYDDYEGINYLETLYKVLNIIKICKLSFNQLNNQFPQKSILGYLSLKIAHFQQAKLCVSQNEIKINKFYENTLCNSEYGLPQKYLEKVKQIDLNQHLQYISYYDLDRTINQQTLAVSDINALCNLCDYLKLRKRFLFTNIEMKIQHRIHKKIHGYDKMSKSSDIYYKAQFGQIDSQYKKQQNQKFCFSPYFFEIDATMECQFILLKNPEILVFQDVIEEFRNIIIYDKINLQLLQTQNEQKFIYLDEYLRAQMDLKVLQISNFLPENSKLTQKQISLFEGNEKLILRSYASNPQNMDNIISLLKDVKALIFNRYIKKFNERPRQNNFQADKLQIMFLKKEQNLKLHLIRQLMHDFLSITQNEAIKVDCFYTKQRIQRLINSLPLSYQFTNEINIKQGAITPYIEKLEMSVQIDQFYSKDDFIMTKCQSLNKQIKYLHQIEQYYIELIRYNSIQLNWSDLLHLNELYLFNLNFDLYDQTKEMLHSSKFAQNPLLSVINYDDNKMDVKDCNSDQITSQQTLIAQGIDKMIEKIKCYYYIRKVFYNIDDNLIRGNIENLDQIKQKNKELYQKTYSIYHNTLFLISKDLPISQYYQQFQIIKQNLFFQHKFNSVNLKHFKSKFITFDQNYIVDNKFLYSCFKKHHSHKYINQLAFINQELPLIRMQLFTNYPFFHHQNVSIMIQTPGIIGVDERLILRKQLLNQEKQNQELLLTEAFIILQNSNYEQMDCIQQKYFLNMLNLKLEEKKLTLNEIVYNNLVNISIQAMHENVQILQQYINVTPDYIERSEIMEKMVSKFNVVIPRVQFIQCLQSTLSKKNNDIHNALKLSFIQGFLNRLKNKSIQTNLLTSGLGYSISNQDIEDCLNLLNRDLFTFAENEINTRMETFNICYEQQKNQISNLKKQLQDMTIQYNQLQTSFDDQVQSLVIAKCNKILFDQEMLKQKYNDYQKCTKKLQDDITYQIDNKYKTYIQSLTLERDRVINRFLDMKQELVTLFTQEIQTNEDFLIKYVQNKTNEMLSEAHLYRKQNTIIQLDSNESQQSNQKSDLLFEPYKFTKALHQLKEQLTKQNQDLQTNYEKQLIHYKEQCTNFEDMKLQLQECKKKENTMKMELITLQQTINQLLKQKDDLVQQNEQLQFEKKRILKSNEDYQQQLKQYKEKIKTHEMKRRNAISVDNYSMTQSVMQKSTLPKLFKSEQKPKLKL